MKEGDIIFLTKRSANPWYRIFISKGITHFTKLKNQALTEVKVHSAIIYNDLGVLKVRDMDKNGDNHYSLVEYYNKFKDRIEIKETPYLFSPEIKLIFNYSCKNTHVKYDFVNTFVYQIIKRLTGRILFKDTTWTRMCAEDVQTEFNKLRYTFSTPEITNPNNLFELIKHWKTYNNI